MLAAFSYTRSLRKYCTPNHLHANSVNSKVKFLLKSLKKFEIKNFVFNHF